MARKKYRSKRPRLLHDTRTIVEAREIDLVESEDGVSLVDRRYRGIVTVRPYGRPWVLFKTDWVRSKRKAQSQCDRYVQSDQCVYDVDRADWFSEPPRHIIEGRRQN